MVVGLTFWIYSRVYVFSWLIYSLYTSKIMNIENGDNYIINFIVYGLSLILVLNVWWTKVLLKVSYKAIMSGKGTVDTQAEFESK